MLAIAAGIPLASCSRGANGPNPGGASVLRRLLELRWRAVRVVTFMMLIYFGLPALGIALDPFPAAVFALALNTAAFNGEIWRAAIADFPHGQLEAAARSA